MSLGLSIYHSGGEFAPRLQYNAKSGRFSRVTRAADGVAIVRAEYPLAQPPTFALDLGSLEIGWLHFQTAMVSIVVVPFGQPMPARPSRDHKAGFRSKVCEGPGAGALEFSANAGVTVNAIEELWTKLTATADAKAGKLPVLRVIDTVASGQNYAPVFELLQWIERDERVFGARTVAVPGQPPLALVAPPAASTAPAAGTWATPAFPTPAPAPIPAGWNQQPQQKAA